MKSSSLIRRQARIRSRISGTETRPRASVFRSARTMSVQLINDREHKTIVAVYGKVKKGQTKMKQAETVGQEVAKHALAQGIKQIVFDRKGHKYHGRIKLLADAMRQGGLEF
jgi:large subunit ribosomal protein L18